MDVILDFYSAHPFWVWMGIAAVFLVVEIGTGSGWLLWPAGSAAVVAFASLGPLAWPWAVLLFAILTIASTFVGRRYLNKTAPSGPDINDPSARIVGHEGAAVAAFENGHGRVLVDGKEWPAEAEADLSPGARVKVISLHGSRLKVKPA